MKLHQSPLSPFARKCRIIIRAKNLNVEEVVVGPDGANGYATGVNPLGKIPVLERGECELPLFDSPLICEYLDSLSDPWLPTSGEGRWKAYRLHRIGDGLSEAVYNYRYETVRDEKLHWGQMIERQETAIRNVISYLETIVDYLPKVWSFGTVSVVCGLAYADFRAGHIDWQSDAPKLAKWFQGFEGLPEYQDTDGYSAA